MKKDMTKIMLTACCIGAAFSLFQGCQIRKEVEELKNLTSNQMRGLYSSVDHLSGFIDQKLEEGSSLLSDSEWSYLGADLKAHEASVWCQVTPKSLNEKLTEAVLVCGGQEYPMELSQGSYAAKLTVPLFEDTQIEKVLFRTGNEVQTEQLNWELSPRQEYLTMVYGQLSASWTGVPSEQGNGCRMRGTVRIEAERKETQPELLSAVLVEKINDTEVQRTELVLAKAEEETEGQIQPSDGGSVCYTCEIEREYEIPNGGSLEFLVEAMDGDRLVHRAVIERFVVSEDGALDRDEDCWWLYGAEAAIYDEDGMPLYVPKQESMMP